MAAFRPTSRTRRLTLAAALAAAVLAGSPVSAPRADAAALRVITPPPAGAPFDYQIGGPYSPADGVAIVARDWHDDPVPGLYSICYVNAFQTQPGEAGWWRRNHRGLLLRAGGRPVIDDEWKEILLDTSTARKRRAIARIHSSAIKSCATRGFQAVEFDNLDSYQRSRSRLSASDNLALARRLVAAAHRNGLAAGQKNSPELRGRARRIARFDFAVAEECQRYAECGAYQAVYGRSWIEVEYSDTAAKWFARACRRRGASVSVIRRDRGVVPRGTAGYLYERC